MDEISKNNLEDHEAILQELQGEQPAPLEDNEKELLEKVVKQDEDEIDDAQDYISNLRKKLAAKGKMANNIETENGKSNKGKIGKERGTKMDREDGDGDAGSTWKKRSLF